MKYLVNHVRVSFKRKPPFSRSAPVYRCHCFLPCICFPLRLPTAFYSMQTFQISPQYIAFGWGPNGPIDGCLRKDIWEDKSSPWKWPINLTSLRRIVWTLDNRRRKARGVGRMLICRYFVFLCL